MTQPSSQKEIASPLPKLRFCVEFAAKMWSSVNRSIKRSPAEVKVILAFMSQRILSKFTPSLEIEAIAKHPDHLQAKPAFVPYDNNKAR